MEYRAEELAIKAGTTVRNLRAYRDHGLLNPPQRRGRTVTYDDSHLDRLLLIAELIRRGYTLANIKELIAGQARGIDVADLLGVEAALLDPLPSGIRDEMTGAQLLDLFDETDGERVKLAVEVGLLVELDGEEVPLAQRRFRIRKPRAFRAGRDLVEAGIPIDQAVAQSGQIAKAVRPIAHDLVMMVVDQLGAYEMVADDTTDPAVGGSRRSAFISVVQRLRPLAGGVVAEELALAMDDEIRQHLAHLIDGLLADSGEGPEPHDQPGS